MSVFFTHIQLINQATGLDLSHKPLSIAAQQAKFLMISGALTMSPCRDSQCKFYTCRFPAQQAHKIPSYINLL